MAPGTTAERQSFSREFAIREWQMDFSAAFEPTEPLKIAATLVAPIETRT